MKQTAASHNRLLSFEFSTIFLNLLTLNTSRQFPKLASQISILVSQVCTANHQPAATNPSTQQAYCISMHRVLPRPKIRRTWPWNWMNPRVARRTQMWNSCRVGGTRVSAVRCHSWWRWARMGAERTKEKPSTTVKRESERLGCKKGRMEESKRRETGIYPGTSPQCNPRFICLG